MSADPAATPRKVRQRDVVSLHRPSGELTFTWTKDAPIEPGDVVQYQGVAFTVAEAGGADDGGIARAYPAQLEALGDVEPWVLRLEPGDVIVLTSKLPLSNDVATAIAEKAKAFFPGYQVLVLDSNVKIGRVRQDAESPDVGTVA